MNVLAWVPQECDTSPGQRFRIEQWDPHLRHEGITITYSSFARADLAKILKQPGHLLAKGLGVTRALGGRLLEAWRASSFDLVYVFREGALLGPTLAERVLGWRNVPFVFDFDDAIWVRYVSPANSRLSYLRFPGKTKTICRLARHVMTGNPYLERYALQFNPRVSVVPTTIDTNLYRPRKQSANTPPVIGWTGSYSTVQYLAAIRPALERLRRRRDFRIVVVGGEGFWAEGVQVEHRPWSSTTEVPDISSFDVGVMPLPDAEWERGKCGLKALQYMALGIPTVASPVGVNSEIIAHGKNGFLAKTEQQWEEALERLLADSALREEFSRAGRSTVESAYSAALHAPRVAAIFREAAG